MKNLFRSFVCLTYFAIPVGVITTFPAFASGGGEAAESKSSSNRALDLPNLVLPVERDGELVNYLFVSANLTISDGVDLWDIREHAHVYRDLILKEAHRHTVGVEGKPMELDVDKFKALLTKVFEAKLGPGSISDIEILASDSQRLFLEG